MEKQIKDEKSQMLKVLQNLDKPQKKIQKKSTTQKQHHMKFSNKRLMLRHQKIKHKENPMISLNPDNNVYEGVTPILAIDCEMVICEDTQYHLARVSIVNYNRHIIFDAHIKPKLKVKNYLREVTNLNFYVIENAKSYDFYKEKIQNILKDKILIGHTIDKDLEQLELEINSKNIRDISQFSFFKNGKFKISLKELSEKYLRLGIQGGVHSSIEDARATLELYKLYKKEIDREWKDNLLKKSNQLNF